jgi:tetratricopeptide (TPR) repeat protein
MEMQEWGRAERAFARGTLALLDGLDGQVAPHLLEAVNAHPSQSNVLIPYVRFLQRQGQRDEALAKLELAHSMRPSAIVSLEAARVAMALGRYDTAQEMARAARAQAKKGHDPPQIRARAYALEAQALISTGQDADLRAARTPMRRALRMEKNGSETLLAAALYAEHTGKDSLALKRYQRLVRVDPQSAAGFFYFGRLLRRSPEQAKESDSALSKARDLDPNGIWGVRAQQILNARD